MQVNIHEAKSQLSRLIQRTLDGEEIIIARNNKPVVRLQIIEQPRTKRQLGALRGIVQSTAPDFNAPLEDMGDYMQGTPINSIKPMRARQNTAKKRSIQTVCEHFEPDFDAASAPSADL